MDWIEFTAKGTILRPRRLPNGHPNCDNYFIHEDVPVHELPTVFFDHPDIHDAYIDGEHLPEGHPSVSDLLRQILPDGHPDPDDLFRNENRTQLPEWHPDLSLLLNMRSIPQITVFLEHPNPQQMYDSNEIIPDSHPSVTNMLEAYLPPDHPGDLDEMLRNPIDYPMPDFHPDLNTFLSFVSGKSAEGLSISLAHIPTFSVFSGHPNLKTDYVEGDPVKDHPSIYFLFESHLPRNHPNIDDLMREGYVLPVWHPSMSSMVEPRSLATSPASLLSYYVASLSLVF